MADTDFDSKLPVRPDGTYVLTDNNEPSTTGLVGVTRGDYADKAAADEAQLLRLTGKQNTAETVRALDIALHDEDGEAYSVANPLPVVLNATEGGTAVHVEKTHLALAKDTPTTWTYPTPIVENAKLEISQVLCSASGKARWELQVGDGADPEVFTKKAVRFNSTAYPNPDITLSQPIVVTGTVETTNVRIVVLNMDNAVQDISHTLIATFIPAP